MRKAADASRRYNDTLPNADYFIHEESPIAKGTGKPVSTDFIKQFPGEKHLETGGDGHVAKATVAPSKSTKTTKKN